MNPTPPAAWAMFLAFFILYTAWGTTYLAIQVGVRDEHLPPALFGGTRVCLAGMVLFAYLAVRGKSLRLPRRDLVGVVIASFLMFVGGNGLINVAEKTVNSGVAAVLVATTPLWIGLFGMFWPGADRLTWRGWVGLLIGLVGVVVLLAPKFQDDRSFFGDLGPLLVLGSAASWALGSIVVRHARLTGSHLTAAAYQMMIGGGSLTLLGLVIGETNHLPEHVTARAAGAYFYLLIIGSLMGFVAFNWLLGHVSAAKAGTYAYVNPIVAVLVGWAAGEEITLGIIGGICVILTGVALVRGGETKVPPPPVATTADEEEGEELIPS